MNPGRFDIQFIKSGRGKAQCPSDPDFPNGKLIDLALEKPGCIAKLPWPAQECGSWIVLCRKCHLRIMITATGRKDDPHLIILPCKTREKRK